MDGAEFSLRGKTYRVRFNARARYMFEKLTGYPPHTLRAFDEIVSDVEHAALLLAGLEGERLAARREDKGVRSKPYTLDEVLDDIIGEADAASRKLMMGACGDALAEAYSGLGEDDSAEASDGEGKAPTTG